MADEPAPKRRRVSRFMEAYVTSDSMEELDQLLLQEDLSPDDDATSNPEGGAATSPSQSSDGENVNEPMTNPIVEDLFRLRVCALLVCGCPTKNRQTRAARLIRLRMPDTHPQPDLKSVESVVSHALDDHAEDSFRDACIYYGRAILRGLPAMEVYVKKKKSDQFSPPSFGGGAKEVQLPFGKVLRYSSCRSSERWNCSMSGMSGRTILYRLLDLYRHKTILSFYKLFIDVYVYRELVVLGKHALVNSLVERFFTGVWPIRRRAEEVRLLERPGLVRTDLCDLSFDLAGVRIATDCVLEICGFFGYGYDLICGVGLLGWDWFVLILSTWRKTVSLTGKNLLTVPTTVLRTARSLRVSAGHGLTRGPSGAMVRDGSRFGVRELNLAFHKLREGSSALQELIIDLGTEADIKRRMGLFLKTVDDTSSFPRLRKLVFQMERPELSPALKEFGALSKIAPNLREIRFPPDLFLCLDQPLLRTIWCTSICENDAFRDSENAARYETMWRRLDCLKLVGVWGSENWIWDPPLLHSVALVFSSLRSFSFIGTCDQWSVILDQLVTLEASLLVQMRELFLNLSGRRKSVVSLYEGENGEFTEKKEVPPIPPPFPNLEKLTLESNSVYQEEVLGLCDFPHLRHLEIECYRDHHRYHATDNGALTWAPAVCSIAKGVHFVRIKVVIGNLARFVVEASPGIVKVSELGWIRKKSKKRTRLLLVNYQSVSTPSVRRQGRFPAVLVPDLDALMKICIPGCIDGSKSLLLEAQLEKACHLPYFQSLLPGWRQSLSIPHAAVELRACSFGDPSPELLKSQQRKRPHWAAPAVASEIAKEELPLFVRYRFGKVIL